MTALQNGSSEQTLDRTGVSTDTGAGICSTPNHLRQPFFNRLMERISKAVSFGLVIFIAAQMLTAICAILVIQWSWLHEDIVQSTTAAGHVITATHSAGLSTRGAVKTEQGFFFLSTPLSVSKQEPLTLELRGDRSRYLCASARRCSQLISTF